LDYSRTRAWVINRQTATNEIFSQVYFVKEPSEELID